jgi:anti-sigma B factor antagonist
MSEPKVLSIEPHDEIVLAEVQCAKLDEDLTQRMQAGVLEAAEKAPGLPVVVALSNVEFLPSLSSGALVSFLTEFKRNDRRFILVGVQPQVRQIFAVTRLDKVFEIYDDVDDALEQIRLTETDAEPL